jgi:hypothetical protein
MHFDCAGMGVNQFGAQPVSEAQSVRPNCLIPQRLARNSIC